MLYFTNNQEVLHPETQKISQGKSRADIIRMMMRDTQVWAAVWDGLKGRLTTPPRKDFSQFFLIFYSKNRFVRLLVYNVLIPILLAHTPF